MEAKVFELEFAKSAQKFLGKIQKKDKDKIIKKLILLAAGAINLDIKKALVYIRSNRVCCISRWGLGYIY